MVQPWQKQGLARPEMQFNSTPTHNAFDRHFILVKNDPVAAQALPAVAAGVISAHNIR